ncbi:GTPase HflX [Candidatus Cloacimonadota bacterium]
MLNEDRAILIGICENSRSFALKESSLDELGRLADTAGVEVVGRFIQNRQAPDKTFYAGKGFLADGLKEMTDKDAGLLIFDNELSPSQGRNIEKKFEISVTDRTEVILNIFHNHARTREAKLQVRLAELQYQLPRLKRLWSHLDREKGQASGSGGASRGMGEKQIEVDKRLIRLEISIVKRELRKVFLQKEVQRKQRERVKKVCLVGYTNAGKSTIFNRLTDAGVLVEDKLFATLETTTRKLVLSKGRDMILSDTVGFISNLPHHLVASFRATLKDVVDADLLLHVVDAADDEQVRYLEEVNKVLQQIEAGDIDQIIVFNKIDIADRTRLKFLMEAEDDSAAVSAVTGENMDAFLQQIDNKLHRAKEWHLLIPHSKQRVINHLHELGQILEKDYLDEGVKISAVINQEDMQEFEQFVIKDPTKIKKAK